MFSHLKCLWQSLKVQEKNKRRLIRVEVTHQEETFQEEVSQEEVSQEEMAAPIDDMIAQKIYKAIEGQGEVLKKMGGCLSKLEESKLKKPVHIEIHEEEESEEWDERDKGDYEINKQFEKFIMDTVAMKEKMDKMQITFRKAQENG
ncbi:hypothetical protein SO802_012468 [Lithocarpus litseifolius]|uniref:Uncharacterized protein n=1 Tax=Lithocarpus litseifolius TaxID=425828 RepID=A0AAW2D500_9ROSI